MITFYFDTSAIVKRYHKEIGSDILDKIFELKDGFGKFLLKVTLCI